MGDLANAFGDSLGGLAPGGAGTPSLGMGNPFAALTNTGAVSDNAPQVFGPSGSVTQTVDPTGATGAAQAISPPSQGPPAQQVGAAGGTQSDAPPPDDRQRGKQGQTQQQTPLQQLIKALQQAQKQDQTQKKANPYQLGSPDVPSAQAQEVASTPAPLPAPSLPERIGAAINPFQPPPADTGEQPPGGYTSPPGTTIAGPSSEVLREGEGGPAPEGRDVTVHKAAPKGSVDPTLEPTTAQDQPQPQPQPQPAADVAPAQRPQAQFPPMMAPSPPPQGGGMLPQLLRMAVPLLALAAMSGFGGGRRGRHHIHPGGRAGFRRPGYYPDGRGGRAFHPGGWHNGWRAHFSPYPWGWRGSWPERQSPLVPLLTGVSLGEGMGGDQGGQQGGPMGAMPFSRERPPAQFGGPGAVSAGGADMPWSGDNFASTLVSAESSGRNDGAPGEPRGGDNGESTGYFNIRDNTWPTFAAKVPGAAQFQHAWQAPPEMQAQVAALIPIARFGQTTRDKLHQRFGDFDENLTVGQLSWQFGRQQAGQTQPKRTRGYLNPDTGSQGPGLYSP